MCSIKAGVSISFIFLFVTSVFSQVKVRIVDSETYNPLPLSTLEVHEAGSVLVSDESGEILLEPPFPKNAKVSFTGYERKAVRLTGRDSVVVVPLKAEERLLNEVIVRGYETTRKLLETPGSVATVSELQIRQYDETSLVPAINTVPGVRMEQRSPGSYRISIRGSSLRSPFDVRNVRIFYNGFPITDPGGTTPLNLLDVSQVGSIEIIKGPAASVYGPGTGGVLLMKSQTADFGENSIEGGATVGSYGLKRFTGSYKSGTESANINFNYSHQSSDGYREHTNFERDVAQVHTTFYPSEKRTITATFLYSNLFYQVPGGLTEQQFGEDPRQARPSGFLPGTVEQQTSVNYKAALTGFTHEMSWSQNFQNITSVYGFLGRFEMPFITDYEREAQLGYGVRTRFSFEKPIGSIKTRFTAGGEYQQGFLAGRNYGNSLGKLDTLKFDDEVLTSQSILFAQVEADLPGNVYVTAGLSYNHLNYDIERLRDEKLDSTYFINKEFNPVIMPRLGVVKKFGESFSFHASISRGFSPPSVEEIRTGDGVLNLDLEAEKGINYEAGVRLVALKEFLSLDLTGFYFQLSETITGYTEGENNVVKFRNAGNTTQKGLEISTNIFMINNPETLIKLAKLQINYTWFDFIYDDFITYNSQLGEQQDYSGKHLPGIAPHTVVSVFDLSTQPGFYFNATYQFIDKVPVNDPNSAYAKSFHLFMAKAGFRGGIGKRFEFDIYAGSDNITDITYSLGNDVNAFGGRYFQTAPGRSFYTGTKIRYNL